jgi:hypothetical protein
MAGWPISFSPNAKPGVKWKQENVTTKADKENMKINVIVVFRSIAIGLKN